jgi:hypothetical protein
VPLCIVPLRRDERALTVGALRQLAATRERGSHPAVDDALSDYTRSPQGAEQFVATAQRLAALLDLVDDDIDVLGARIGAVAPVRGETQRVVLTAADDAAYQQGDRAHPRHLARRRPPRAVPLPRSNAGDEVTPRSPCSP